ncbi:hypothetical protein [Zeaxanthinibacter enoshimensis]|uniref:Cardiolipin synthetase n=1 Tax=Zeaxanthinibacter enoshimensis TaxID=392009 RepID=A0A4R6TM46_9FLAO|nr:hypothetical protein [Zeaxanthinibacter enoshimensis]TDQ30898.1 hypothetical protein CLV82_1595 [Zeaxanthinibacter enoshimensis]
MKRFSIVFTLFLILFSSGCSSTSLVSSWKNPDIVLFDAYKVLVVGMTQNERARLLFETNMRDEFTKRNVEAMRSLDVFDVAFTNSARSEEELDEVEEQLLDKDFDAILFTKVVGYENKRSFREQVLDWETYMEGFKEDYNSNQGIYFKKDYYQDYDVYYAETSLYCICVGKDRKLIWRGTIEITDPKNVEKVVDDYIQLVVYALQEQDLIIRKKTENETTSL